MKAKHIILSLLLLSTTLNLGAAKTPLATITVQNYTAFIKGVSTLANTASSHFGAMIDPNLRQVIGSSNMQGIDLDKPWHATVWMDSMGAPPVTAIFIPVSNYDSFKSGLSNRSLFSDHNPMITTLISNQHAVVIIKSNPLMQISAEQKNEIIEQGKTLSSTPPHLLSVRLHISDELSKQILATLPALKKGFLAGMTASLNSNPQLANMPGMTDIFELYFRMFEIVIEGTKEYSFHMDVTSDHIILHEELKTVPGTDFASILAPHSGGLGTVLSKLDSEHAFVGAFSVKQNDKLEQFIMALMEVSYKLYGAEFKGEIKSLTAKMVKNLFPFNAGFTADMDPGYQMAFAYELESADKAKKTYRSILDSTSLLSNSLTGKNGPYKYVKIEKAVREIGGITIDRITFMMNLDHPMFQTPGQKEQIEVMFPGGILQMEYALAEKFILMSMGENIETLIYPVTNPFKPNKIKILDQTVFAGKVNILPIIKSLFAQTPNMPDNIKSKIAALPSEGDDIEFKIDIDSKYKSETYIPLSLIETLVQMSIPTP